MKDFFTDKNNLEKDSSQKTHDGQSDEQNNQPTEQYVSSQRGQNSTKGTITLVVLFVVGILCLLYMIKETKPLKLQANVITNENIRFEIAIQKLAGAKKEMFKGMDDIVRKFYELSNVEQVTLDQLIKNPFKQTSALTASSEKTEIDDTSRPRQVKQMKLKSIMTSPNGGCCMIDDDVLFEGDVIYGYRVDKIGNDYVQIYAKGKTFILKIASE